MHFSHEATSLILELADPIPPPLRTRFLERVRRLLRDDETLNPARIVAACAEAQRELLIAPAADLEQPTTPASQVPRSPFRRRA